MAIISDVQYDLNAGVTADVDAAVAASTGLRLVGFVARESAGTAADAEFGIVHGATVSGGDAVIPVRLVGKESKTFWMSEGIPMPNGISIDHIDGELDVTLFYREMS